MRIPDSTIKEMEVLRHEGYSLSEISDKCHVSKSTASRLVGSVAPVGLYMDILRQKRNSSVKRKQEKEKQALDNAISLITTLSIKEKLLFLSALYWGEGNKKDFIFTNSDPSLIQVFLACMRDVFHVPEQRFQVSVRIYEDLDVQECVSYWSHITSISPSQFGRVTILEGKKTGKLQHGMCRVRISRGGDFLKAVIAVNRVVTHHLSL